MMHYKILTLDDMKSYAELVCLVEEDMIKRGCGNYISFLSLPEIYHALTEGRIYSLWDDSVLVATLIAGKCNLSSIYSGDFSEYDGVATYLRNGMVHPAYLGRGLYSQFMQYIANELDGDLVGTIIPNNKGALYACAGAGLLPVKTVYRARDDQNLILVARAGPAKSFGEILAA